jgi:hypothetical protein
MDPEWTDPAWLAFGVACLAGWALAWNLLPEDTVVPGGHVHDLHAVAVTVMGLLSLAQLLPEMVVLHFASTYFVADTFHSLWHRKWKVSFIVFQIVGLSQCFD